MKASISPTTSVATIAVAADGTPVAHSPRLGRLTANLVAFHEDPENPARIIVPSQRGDEIGVATRELSDMQRDLVSMLSQKSRLAALGLADGEAGGGT